MQGTIPYLGTFLTDLVMMDTAMKDYTEVRRFTSLHAFIALPVSLTRFFPFSQGGLINFEKRRKVKENNFVKPMSGLILLKSNLFNLPALLCAQRSLR